MHISLRFVPFLPPSMRHSHVDKIIVGSKDGGARCHKVQTHNGQMKIFVFQWSKNNSKFTIYMITYKLRSKS